jgi:hypothetical protein
VAIVSLVSLVSLVRLVLDWVDLKWFVFVSGLVRIRIGFVS